MLRLVVRSNWHILLAFSFFALLPVGRQIEIPLSLFALSLALLARKKSLRSDLSQAARIILPLFACIWIPMLVSCLDSLNPEKSWAQTIPSLRFAAAALSIAVVFRERNALDTFQKLMCWLLLFWAADGFFQLAFGHDVFGVPMHEDRLNALFFDSYFSYGPTLAILSPLALDYMYRHWRGNTWLIGFALILGAVFISGMRSGWVIMAVVTTAFAVAGLSDSTKRRQVLMIPVVAAITLAISIFSSPLLQERLTLTSKVTLLTEQAIDDASSYRLPIFRAAIAMYRDHPVNGIGVRAMRATYPDYAPPDDPHILHNPQKNRAHHAHNIVLEFMTDTGTIGLIGLIAACVVLWRIWRMLDPARKKNAFPYLVSLMAMFFPLNSYFAFYGVYMMSVTWIMVGLLAAAFLADRQVHD